MQCNSPYLIQAMQLQQVLNLRITSQICLINKLEKKYKKEAARFTLSRYGRRYSCTAMKKGLNWEPLSSRCKKLRLKLMYEIYHNKTGIDREMYLKPPDYISARTDHQCKIREYRARMGLYANSFFCQNYCLVESAVM